jgi:hypothetical protein
MYKTHLPIQINFKKVLDRQNEILNEIFVLTVLGYKTFSLECTHVKSGNKINSGYVLNFKHFFIFSLSNVTSCCGSLFWHQQNYSSSFKNKCDKICNLFDNINFKQMKTKITRNLTNLICN